MQRCETGNSSAGRAPTATVSPGPRGAQDFFVAAQLLRHFQALLHGRQQIAGQSLQVGILAVFLDLLQQRDCVLMVVNAGMAAVLLVKSIGRNLGHIVLRQVDHHLTIGPEKAWSACHA
jgi:hypothetical protein